MAFTPFTEGERPSMANFNEKFQQAMETATEGAIAQAPKAVYGTYTGTGATTKTLSFGFVPKFVVLHRLRTTSYTHTQIYFLYDAINARNAFSDSSNADYNTALSWSSDGMSVTLSTSNNVVGGAFNTSDQEYGYFAIG